MGRIRQRAATGRAPTRTLACGSWMALVLSCAPSREEAFDPTRATIEARTGQRARWHERDPQGPGRRERDDAVEALLRRELTPDAAAQIALLNNRALQARFEEIGIARANLVRATLLANPSLSAELLLPVTADEIQGGLGVELDILSSLFQPTRRALALTELEATQLDVAGAAIDLSFEARAALLRHVATRQLVDVLETFTEAAALTSEVAERLREAGNITELVVLRERALYESARLELATEKAALVRGREALNRALGLFGERTAWRAPAALPALPDDDATVADLERRALESSLELEVGRRRIDVAGRALGLADVQRYLPALEVGVAGEREDEGWLAGPSASLALPLFDQGQANVAAREAELRRFLERYAATAVEIRAEARRVRGELEIARDRAVFLRDTLVPLRTKILEEALLQYNAMAISVFELLATKRMQLEVEVQAVEALRDYWMLRLASEQLVAGRRPSFDVELSDAGAGGATRDAEETLGQAAGLGGDE